MTDPFTLNQWYVITSSQELPDGQVRETELLDHPVRAERRDGVLSVTSDKGARALPAQERYGYVWTTLGAPERPLFQMPEFDEPGRRLVICGAITVHASGLRIVENFLDLAHFPFVHPGVLGAEDSTEVLPYKVEQRAPEDELWVSDAGFRQPQAMAASSGAAEVQYLYRVAQPFSSVLYKSSPGRDGAFDLVGLFAQPRRETLCDVHCFMLVYDEVTSDNALLHFQQAIFLQDRIILENQRPRRLPLAPGAEASVRADGSSMAYRRWLRGHGLTCGALAEAAP